MTNKNLELLHTLDAVCCVIHAFEEKILQIKTKIDWQDQTIATLEKESEEYVFVIYLNVHLSNITIFGLQV